MGTCCSTSKHATGEGSTSYGNDDSTIANPIQPQPTVHASSSNEEHEELKTAAPKQVAETSWRSGEQQMEDDPERIDVRPDVHRIRLAAQLLGGHEGHGAVGGAARRNRGAERRQGEEEGRARRARRAAH